MPDLPQAVTFDFWNTIFRENPGGSRPRRVAAWLAILDGEGLAADEAAAGQAFDQSWEVFHRHWHDNRPYGAEDAVSFMLGRLKLDPPPAVRDALIEVLTDPSPVHDPQLTPNVAACIATLADAGVKLGIICDVGYTPSRTLRRFLDAAGLLGSFSHWSFSDEVGAFKPDRRIFVHAMDGLGVEDPARMAHIGDLRRTDVAGAQAMGITSVRYAGVFDDPPDERGEVEADHVVDDHALVPGLFGLA